MKKAMCGVMMGLCLTAIQTTAVQAETLPAVSAPVFMKDDELAQEQGARVKAYVGGQLVYGLYNIASKSNSVNNSIEESRIVQDFYTQVADAKRRQNNGGYVGEWERCYLSLDKVVNSKTTSIWFNSSNGFVQRWAACRV